MKQTYYSPKEFADYMGVHYRTVLGWCNDGLIPAVNIAGSWRVHRDAFNLVEEEDYADNDHEGNGVDSEPVGDLPS